jgi:hypothetical protein
MVPGSSLCTEGDRSLLVLGLLAAPAFLLKASAVLVSSIRCPPVTPPVPMICVVCDAMSGSRLGQKKGRIDGRKGRYDLQVGQNNILNIKMNIFGSGSIFQVRYLLTTRHHCETTPCNVFASDRFSHPDAHTRKCTTCSEFCLGTLFVPESVLWSFWSVPLPTKILSLPEVDFIGG